MFFKSRSEILTVQKNILPFWDVIDVVTTSHFLSLNLGHTYVIESTLFSFFTFYNVSMFIWKQGSKLATFHPFNQIVRVTYSQLRTHSCHLHSVYQKRLSLGFQRISLTLRRWACHEWLGLTENESTKKSISSLLIFT